jgi:hypothetical protein
MDLMKEMFGEESLEKRHRVYPQPYARAPQWNYYGGKPPRDAQRRKAYNWERSMFGRGIFTTGMTVQEFMETIRKACVEFQIAEPRVKWMANNSGKCHFCPPHVNRKGKRVPATIMIRDWGRNIYVLCHELAHYINYTASPQNREGHGAEWMRIYIDLLDRYTTYTKAELQLSARTDGLKVEY